MSAPFPAELGPTLDECTSDLGAVTCLCEHLWRAEDTTDQEHKESLAMCLTIIARARGLKGEITA